MGRPHRGNFQAWLRGGQTVGHTYDMIVEVVGRLLIVSVLWAVACWMMVNVHAADREEVYGSAALQAVILQKIGPPLPQAMTVKDPQGKDHVHPVAEVGQLPFVKPYAKTYLRRFRFGVLMFLAGVSLIAIGSAVWFMESGKSKLKARHVRGQTVAGVRDLVLQIDKFNAEEMRRRSHVHHAPARLAGVPYPFETEQEHTLLVGSPGSGKSRALHQLLLSIRQRGDRAVIYDAELDFIRLHYDPATDVILNPFDDRSARWSPLFDATELVDFEKLGHSLFKEPKHGDPYWTNVARQIFTWATYSLRQSRPHSTLADLLAILFGDPEALDLLLEGTPAAKHVAGGGQRVSSLESVLVEGVTPLIYLGDASEGLSIRAWVNQVQKRPGFLFLSAPETHFDSLRPLIAFWSEIVVSALLSRQSGTERLTTWMILDEFPTLGRIDRLADGPQRLRKYGGAIVLGMQQVSQIEDIYGREKARTIVGQCATKLILRCQDPQTAEFMSEQLGRRLVRRVDENTSYGANSIRDGVGLAPREELEPIALPEDVMNLPAFQGFIRVSNKRESGAFPVAPVKFEYGAMPDRAQAFVPRAGPDPVAKYFAPPTPGPSAGPAAGASPPAAPCSSGTPVAAPGATSATSAPSPSSARHAEGGGPQRGFVQSHGVRSRPARDALTVEQTGARSTDGATPDQAVDREGSEDPARVQASETAPGGAPDKGRRKRTTKPRDKTLEGRREGARQRTATTPQAKGAEILQGDQLTDGEEKAGRNRIGEQGDHVIEADLLMGGR